MLLGPAKRLAVRETGGRLGYKWASLAFLMEGERCAAVCGEGRGTTESRDPATLLQYARGASPFGLKFWAVAPNALLACSPIPLWFEGGSDIGLAPNGSIKDMPVGFSHTRWPMVKAVGVSDGWEEVPGGC